MQTVPIHQAKSQLSELIRAVEQGEEVVLTRHGKRVIRLIREPETEQPSVEARRQAIRAELDALRAKVGAARPGFDELWEEHKRERDARGAAWVNEPKTPDAGR
ncbi:type II toxin-antitoxin system prevent-host-death family antitoxin [Ramlibacter tataouinensis]|uniref:type II toxin-antitoxin system Phd/YefM family antitoxin n=1 Tax=Ramlibacter tataouinensis TaxID=94132 RepID=UPI0022F3D4A3|nr:type II toxin-antitoxin system prevent-host-death family antitoxin [Ramlibacter tataouinensis]WBY02041.1 type II toxin-antitoxin system prevent-host-death family antitoxin [Ramlibacter tataouinensis]